MGTQGAACLASPQHGTPADRRHHCPFAGLGCKAGTGPRSNPNYKCPDILPETQPLRQFSRIEILP